MSASGSTFRIDEDPTAVQGQVCGRTDGELSPVASCREMGDDLPIVHRKWYLARMGNQHHRRH